MQVTLSLGSRNVAVGQLAIHLPPDSTKPGRQPVHWTWSMVEATVNDENLQLVQLLGQASRGIRTGLWMM